MLKKNDIFETVIEDLTLEGSGVCKKDGFTFFVPQTAPGDVLRVRSVKILKSYGFGIIEELLSPSPDRIIPDCPVYRQCGGCVFRHLRYETEAKRKEKAVSDAFQRLGGFSFPSLPILQAQNPNRYRNKAQFPLGYDKNGKAIAGFFASRSHRIVEAADCPLQASAFAPIVKAVLDWINEYAVPVYDEKTKKGLLRHIFLRCGDFSGEVMLCLVSTRRKVPHLNELKERLAAFPEIKSLLLNLNSKDTNVILGKETLLLFGKQSISDRLLGVDFSIDPLSFFQVNPRQTERLYSLAYEFAGFTGKESLLDLYCGIGSIGLCAYSKVKEVVGVEIVPEAIENAVENAKNNRMERTKFFCGDAKKAAAAFLQQGYRPDTLIVDPPRKGCDSEVLLSISKMSPEKIVMISCNPATAARDCKLLCELGYKLEKYQAVDMFPRTAHVETVCLLTRNHTEHYMRLNKEPFYMMSSGQKTVELRLLDEKRQKLKHGDTIVFACDDETERTMKVQIIALHRFKNFEELYQNLPLLKCGYTEENVSEAHFTDMEAYYSTEEQEKYGVVGIEIFPLRQVEGERCTLPCREDNK